jgi:uncharacterized protein YgiM (DUF1202 family)
LSLPSAFTVPALATEVTKPQENGTFASAEMFSRNQDEFQLAQSGSCRQVVAESGLYVREGPTIFSEAIGILNYGRNVTVQPGGTERWVRISAPLAGYVYAGWLGACQSAVSIPSESCRLVIANKGAPIRNLPSTEGIMLGKVASGRRVTIENRGANGWVPISAPLEGYISSAYLTGCRPRA